MSKAFSALSWTASPLLSIWKNQCQAHSQPPGSGDIWDNIHSWKEKNTHKNIFWRIHFWKCTFNKLASLKALVCLPFLVRSSRPPSVSFQENLTPKQDWLRLSFIPISVSLEQASFTHTLYYIATKSKSIQIGVWDSPGHTLYSIVLGGVEGFANSWVKPDAWWYDIIMW